MVSVVIPAYNNAPEVDRLLGSIAEHCRGSTPFEVVVVDDGSPDEALEAVCARHPFARRLRLPENRGAAAARNAGVREARAELVVFFDADMVLLSDVIGAVRRVFEDPAVDAVVGAVSPTPMNAGAFRRFWALVKAYSLPTGRESSTFYPMVAAIRKRVFLAIGGFDERFKGASIEDYEISMRLRAASCRIQYHPELLVATHYKPIVRSLSQSFDRATKWVLLFRKRLSFDNHTTTSGQAAGAISGAALLLSLALVAVRAGSLWVSAVLAALYLMLNAKFFQYAGRTVGWAFVPAVVSFHLLLSVVVCAGAARGFVQSLLLPHRRSASLYR
jgi:glycosyltransferase involved in cell wall biosynthesis